MEENKTKLKTNVIEELSDDKLEEVTGGSNFTLHFFDKEEDVFFIFPIYSEVLVKENIFCSTVKCEVIRHEVFYDPQYHCYEDLYIVKDPNNELRRILRDDVVNQAF